MSKANTSAKILGVVLLALLGMGGVTPRLQSREKKAGASLWM